MSEAEFSWQQRLPGSAQAWACVGCDEALQKAAPIQARSWDELVLLESHARAEGGEVWDARTVDYWFPPGAQSTPTAAKVRQVQVSIQVVK